LVEPLLSARQAQPIRTRTEIDALVGSALTSEDDEEAQLDALRRIKRQEVLRIGLFDVAGELDPPRVTRQLTDLAESLLGATIRLVPPRGLPPLRRALGDARGGGPGETGRGGAELLIGSRFGIRLFRRRAGARRPRGQPLRGVHAVGATNHPRADHLP